jgi:N,N-dimethylformamidase
LEDAAWNVAFEWTVPQDCKSGIYAVHLTAGDDEDYVPFVVTPARPRARIAFLAPTLSYLVYANQRFIDPIRASLDLQESDDVTPQDAYMREQGLLSCYDLHSDGSGVCYSSRWRPILNFRPGYVMPSRSLAAFSPRHLNADLHLLDWLDSKQFDYDVISDDDLHREGCSALEPYQVILTGSHPEYWTEPMLHGMETYQSSGGRLMYLGGNGFYWVTTLDSKDAHVAEVRRWGGTRVWEAAPGEYYHSTTGELGGLWRNRGRTPQKMVSRQKVVVAIDLTADSRLVSILELTSFSTVSGQMSQSATSQLWCSSMVRRVLKSIELIPSLVLRNTHYYWLLLMVSVIATS